MYQVHSEHCESVCSNREWIRSGGTGAARCVLTCPPDEPLRIGTNTCAKCDYIGGQPYSVWQKPSCKDVCSNRIVQNEFCSLPSCPEDKPLRDKNGGCHSCKEANGVDVGEDHPEYCDVCEDRRIIVGGFNGKSRWCSLCGVKGSTVENKPVINDIDGKCFSCDEENEVHQIQTEQCESVCQNRKRIGSDGASGFFRCVLLCPKDKPLRIGTNTCAKCNDTGTPYSAWQVPSCKEACPERIDLNNRCGLPACPKDKPLRDKNGGCHSCKEENGVDVGTAHPEYCDVCKEQGRHLIRGAWNDTNWCSLCGVKGSTVENKPVINDAYGTCHSCDDPNEQYQLQSEHCESVCENREWIRNGGPTGAARCVLTCPPDEPLRIESNSCATCDYTGEPHSVWQKPSCEAVCPNRKNINNMCVWQEPFSCPTGHFKGENGKCYKCNITSSIAVEDEESCAVCVNRVYQDGNCVDPSAG